MARDTWGDPFRRANWIVEHGVDQTVDRALAEVDAFPREFQLLGQSRGAPIVSTRPRFRIRGWDPEWTWRGSEFIDAALTEPFVSRCGPATGQQRPTRCRSLVALNQAGAASALQPRAQLVCTLKARFGDPHSVP
jgi:hypothetical protein